MIRIPMLALASLALAVSAVAQPAPRTSDVETPEAIVQAAYAAIAREPGQPFDWDRFRSLFLPDARLITVPRAAHQVTADAPGVVLPAIDEFASGRWPARAEKITTLERSPT